MGIKKEEKNISTEGEKNTAQKKRYVKPKLEAVMLFADQVLGTCKLAPPCLPLEPLMS